MSVNPFTDNIRPKKLRKMLRKIHQANTTRQGTKPPGYGYFKPQSARFHNAVTHRFGSVPSIGASLKSLVQTRPGILSVRAGAPTQQATEMKPSENRDFKPAFSALQSSVNLTAHLPQSEDNNQQFTSVNKTSKSVETPKSMNIHGTDCKSPFPGLIIFKGISKFYKGVQFLKKNFQNSPYGPLTLMSERSSGLVKVNIWACGKHLAEGQGPTAPEAQHNAVYSLLKKLRATNHYIEVKESYIPAKKFPEILFNVDPSLSHIYKVVYLKKLGGPVFPHDIRGAVDYVSSYADLIAYIENYGRTGSKADLFILNVDKSQRPEIYQACRDVGMKARPLVGCSDRGVVADYLENCQEVFQELMKCGGETIKYRLYPPGSGLESVSIDEEEKTHDEQALTAPEQSTSTPQEDIVISPWISQNLIIMEVFNSHSLIECPKEVIFISVRSCPALEEFIIEKKKDPVSKLITGEALIDRYVVGRATSYLEKYVKKRAPEDALRNLRKYCPFIEIKRSYSGSPGDLPEFIFRRIESKQNIYKIVHPSEARNEYELHKLFKQFWSSPVEDLFFLENFTLSERELAVKLSQTHGLLVRYMGNKDNRCVCVYKKQSPQAIYKKLYTTNSKENEKYKLHLPPIKPKPAAAAASQMQCEPIKKNFKNLFDFKQTDSRLSEEKAPPQLTSATQSQIAPFKPNPNMETNQHRIQSNNGRTESPINVGENYLKSSERFETVSSTLGVRGPAYSGLTKPNARIETATGMSERTEVCWQSDQTDQEQALEWQLWQRRKYSSQDKRSSSETDLYDGTEREWKSLKMICKNEGIRDPIQQRNKSDFSTCEKSSNLLETNSRTELSNLNSNRPYNSEIDVWMETEPAVPPLPISYSESQKIVQPVNAVEHLFDLRPKIKDQPNCYEKNITSRGNYEGTKQCLNQNLEEKSINNTLSRSLDWNEPNQQRSRDVQYFNEQSNVSNPSGKPSQLKSLIQQMEEQLLGRKNLPLTDLSQSNLLQKPMDKEPQANPLQTWIEKEPTMIGGSSQPSNIQNNTEEMLKNQQSSSSHPFVSTSNFRNASPQDIKLQRNAGNNSCNETSSSMQSERQLATSRCLTGNKDDKIIHQQINPLLSANNNQCDSTNITDNTMEKSTNISNLFDVGGSSRAKSKQIEQDLGKDKISSLFDKRPNTISDSFKCITDFSIQTDQFWKRNVKSVYDQVPKPQQHINTCSRGSEGQTVHERKEVKQLFDLGNTSSESYKRKIEQHSDQRHELKEHKKRSTFGQEEEEKPNVSTNVPKGSDWEEPNQEKLQQLNNEKYYPFEQTDHTGRTPKFHSSQVDQPCTSSSEEWKEESKNLTFQDNTGCGEHDDVERQKTKDLPNVSSRLISHGVIPPPPLPPATLLLDNSYWGGPGYDRVEEASYQQLKFTDPSDENTNFRSTGPEAEKHQSRDFHNRSDGSKFSDLFDMNKSSRTDSKQYAQEDSRRDWNRQERDRGNNSRKYLETAPDVSDFSSSREISQHQTHSYWNRDIKRSYDQRRPEPIQEGQSNFTNIFDVGRSQCTQNSPFRPNHDRRPERIEKKRGHRFSKINKYMKHAK